MTDNNNIIDNINEVTDKVYVQLIDGSTAWVPTNAHKLDENKYLILPDNEFNENDFINLSEFIPGDIVALSSQTFHDGTQGFVCKKLFKPSTRQDKKFFEFLFKTAFGEFEINKNNLEYYKSEIEKIKELKALGKNFYDSTLMTIEQLEHCES
ncbi:MAG: hypothetical protein Q8M15_14435 [Bacteroidota bacterium]|nr:hypothetical protein [Bacteroidota bacterium]